LSELLSSPESRIGKLAAQARAKVDLADHIRTGLPPDLANEIVHCAIADDGTLIIRATRP